jgi:hypothetical protein
MSNAVLKGNASGTGTVTLETPNTNSDRTISLPDADGTMVYADASGNVGIGTSSPTAKAQIGDATVAATNRLVFGKAQTATESNLPAIGQQSAGVGNDLALAGTSTSATIRFYTGASTNSGEIGTGSNAERMRIDSSGNLLVGTTTAIATVSNSLHVKAANPAYFQITGGSGSIVFRNSSNSTVGTIAIGASSTAYNTSSDYRLKENIAPMTGALNKVAQLKPVTYKWKVDGSDSQGFIAHELAEVVPDCVTGEKDAVDAEGNPVYQGIDTSFLVATLTAAIQELKAELDATKAEVAALKGVS